MAEKLNTSPTGRLVDADYARIEYNVLADILNKVEWGYRQAEKGLSLEQTLDAARKHFVYGGKSP